MTSANDAPLNGAGAEHVDPDWQPRPFRVKVVDEEGPAWWVTVNAIGPNDAREQGRQKAYDQGAERPGVLAVKEVVPDRGRMTDEPTYREAS